MIRLFAAIAVPKAIAEGLARHQVGMAGAAWRPREALHVTLRFFGDLREDLARDLDAEMLEVEGPALTLSLAGVGHFGEGRDIRALWAGVADNPDLRLLAARCEAAARRAGLAADTRTYRPHVTLAYLRRPDPPAVAAWTQAHNLLKSPPFTVERFGVYSSWRTQQGSAYRLEASYPLMAETA